MQGTTTRRRRGYSAGTCPKPFNSAPMAVNSASFGAPHVRPTGFTWGAPNGIAKITHPKTFIRSCSAQVCALGAARREQGAQVRVPGRLISPPWRSIRFRLAPRTYAPWGVRVGARRNQEKNPPEIFYRSFLRAATSLCRTASHPTAAPRGKSNERVVCSRWVRFLTPVGSPHVLRAHMGVHRTCGEPNKTGLTPTHGLFYRSPAGSPTWAGPNAR